MSDQRPDGPIDGSGPSGGPGWGPYLPPPYLPQPPIPVPTPAERVRLAVVARGNTDYIFNFWTALGWSLLTLGFYGYYVFYQLVRRMRDHNARRLELLDAAIGLGWEEAGRRGLQAELAPSFQRASSHLAVLKKMTGDFREPVIWLVLSIVAGGIVHIVAFILLDQDLVGHDRAEVGLEYELAFIYGRFGVGLASPEVNRVKRQHNYVGRVVATVFSFGIYSLWWLYNMMQEPNRHFYTNWVQEDALLSAVQVMR